MAIRKNLKGWASRLLKRSGPQRPSTSPAPERVRSTPAQPQRELVLETDEAEDDTIDVEVDSALVADWLAEGRDLLFVDIREVVEIQGGHIEGSHLLPMSDLGERMEELPRDRDLVVYCAAGARSYGVAHQMRDHGFMSYSMVGGIGSWLAQGGRRVIPPPDSPSRPVDIVRLTQAASQRLGFGPTIGTIQEIRRGEDGITYTLYSDGERLSGLAVEDLVGED